MIYINRVPNYADIDVNSFSLNVLQEFLDNYLHQDKALIQIIEGEIPPPKVAKKMKKSDTCFYIKDLNNPFTNGWMIGSKTQLSRFLNDYKRKQKECNVDQDDLVFMNGLIYEVEYISENKPFPLILVNDGNNTLAVNALTDIDIISIY